MKNLNRHLFKEVIQMVNKQMKRCSILLVAAKLYQNTVNHYFTLTSIAIFLKWKIASVDKEEEKLECSYIAYENEIYYDQQTNKV